MRPPECCICFTTENNAHWHWCEAEDDEPRAGAAEGCCMFKAVLVVDEVDS